MRLEFPVECRLPFLATGLEISNFSLVNTAEKFQLDLLLSRLKTRFQCDNLNHYHNSVRNVRANDKFQVPQNAGLPLFEFPQLLDPRHRKLPTHHNYSHA